MLGLSVDVFPSSSEYFPVSFITNFHTDFIITLLVSDVMYMLGLFNDLLLAEFSVWNFYCFVVARWAVKVKMSFTFEDF
jgi:hypothetical protein